ncbi:MAG: hypothetical protein PVH54_04035, partial [Gammaproteobacteria bacterium]
RQRDSRFIDFRLQRHEYTREQERGQIYFQEREQIYFFFCARMVTEKTNLSFPCSIVTARKL